MKQLSLLQLIAEHLFGHKYYVNIVNTIGTDRCETTSFIHRSMAEARDHIAQIKTTKTFLYIETVSFRSRRRY